MTLLKTGEPIDPAKAYVVAGWARSTKAPKGRKSGMWSKDHIRKLGTVTVQDNNSVDVTGV